MTRLVKNTAAICLAVLMLVKMMGMPLSWLNYTINKNYISAELCENKAKPLMHCNGQCVLMKKLAKANESNETGANKPEVKNAGLDYYEAISNYSFELPNILAAEFYMPQILTTITGFPGSIFRPPAENDDFL
ncbi:MAG TPA: hypothetical protein VK628_08580 [Flavitalea sp.]|nr:hypothetical protein [Flavitalea sp.]